MADAQIKLVKTVNFGKGLGNREGSVFYQIFDTLGTGSVSRTSAGVYELGTNTGIYGSQVTIDQSFSGSIIWEVTASNGNIVFASDEVEVDTKLTRHFTVGQWEIKKSTNEMIFYQDDNVTEIGRFDLKDSEGNPSTDTVFKRIRK